MTLQTEKHAGTQVYITTAQPVVSVVMAARDAEETIRASIESVTRQTYPDWELIIIDDSSWDTTPQIIGEAIENDPRIRVHENIRILGVAKSRNIGIELARGEWVAFLDSDDLWREDKLEKQLTFMAETGAAISYTGTAYIDEENNPSEYVLRAERELTYPELLRKNLMSCSSVMVRRDIMERTGFASDDMSEDYAAWMQIVSEVGCAYGLDEPLLVYRMSGTSKSSGRYRSGVMTYRAYRHVGYEKLPAFALTARYALHSITKRFLIGMGRT